jgi:hypothetical protein
LEVDLVQNKRKRRVQRRRWREGGEKAERRGKMEEGRWKRDKG